MPSTISAGTTAGTAIAIAGDTTGNLAFQTNGTTTAMTIDTSQNVGIGTASPGVKLDVSGGDFRIQQSASTARQRFVAGSNQWNVETSNSTNGYAIYDAAAGQLRFFIDGSGYVTMPNQPAFLAYRSSGVFSGTGIYICNTVTFNDGSHYNSSTGRFTAPVAGRYQLNFFVLAQNPDDFDLSIFVNGSSYSGMEIRCNSNAVNSNFTLAISGIIKLSANDIVDPRVTSQPSGSIFGSGLNGFSMYLLG